jgi:hypothetical protein
MIVTFAWVVGDKLCIKPNRFSVLLWSLQANFGIKLFLGLKLVATDAGSNYRTEQRQWDSPKKDPASNPAKECAKSRNSLIRVNCIKSI